MNRQLQIANVKEDMTVKEAQLAKVAEDIIKDGVCPELMATATQLVIGEGSADADILFIGEAPGAAEDKQGKPFVGASGKFLAEMLESIGLNRDDVFITNIVKYRPPNNRDPLPEEIKAFWPYLMRQVEIIKPKLIVPLGRYAMNVFLPGLKISQAHGQAKRIRVRLKASGHQGVDVGQGAGEKRSEAYEQYGERASQPGTKPDATSNNGVGGSADNQVIASLVVLPLYHPAAALYNGGMRATLLEDFSTIPKLLETL